MRFSWSVSRNNLPATDIPRTAGRDFLKTFSEATMYSRRVNLAGFNRALCRLALLALAATSPALLLAQNGAPAQEPFYLHDGDTVVFYGDSITEQRFYTHWIELYTATRFPHMQIQFYNAGNGGDRVTGGSAGPIDLRLSRDVFAQKPTVVTIMLGMNDGSYRPLDKTIESKYADGYEHILSSIQKSLPSARITLLGPSPYDEVTRPPVISGYNSTMTRFAEIDSELAAKNNAKYIDLNAPFVGALKRGIAINPLATQLLLPDRIHPEQPAHWFMAEAILKGWNAPAIVSSTTIDAVKTAIVDAKNTQITGLSGDQGSLTWTQLDGALPLPMDVNNVADHFIREITDIEQDLDQQPLKVIGLKPATYQVNIDSAVIGTFTDAQLAKGINLANYGTPMRGQAYSVRWLVRDREEAHYVRMRMFVTELKTGSPAEPGATDITKFEQALQAQIYEAAQPRPHIFKIKQVANPIQVTQ